MPASIWLSRLLPSELQRYKEKGLWVIPALLVGYIFYAVTPIYAYPLYEMLLSSTSEEFAIWVFPNILSAIFAGLTMAFFTTLYSLKHPFFESLRVKQFALRGDSDKDKPAAKKTKHLSIKNNIQMIAMSWILFKLGLGATETRLELYPSTVTIVLQVIFCLVVEDTVGYWTHRMFHIPYLFNRFHRIHHEYANDMNSFASQHLHPFNFFFEVILAYNLGPILLGNMHVVAFYYYNLTGLYDAIEIHGGYVFHWNPVKLLPMVGNSESHYSHHLLGKGNYATVFSFWDGLCGTDVSESDIKAIK